MDIRNIAIIAHVDHGKTTLVDSLLQQSDTLRENSIVEERAMDNNALERERGITILAKNTAINYKGVRINILDTPGHADFGGEVERIMNMVDAAILLVDAIEGTMPQTRFVLKKALEANVLPIVVINKVDRDFSKPLDVVNEVIDLFIELEASDEQLDFPVIYASGLKGYASYDYEFKNAIDMKPLLDTILQYVPSPVSEPLKPLLFQPSLLDYNEYVGRIGIGKILQGTVEVNKMVTCGRIDGTFKPFRIQKLYGFLGLNKVEIEEAIAGDIVAIAGLPDILVGETICDIGSEVRLAPIRIEKPTVQMTFGTNTSPFVGREGKLVTSSKLEERLKREVQKDVSLLVERGELRDEWIVSGRGELHLGILIENMRREGYEFQVSRPRVILQEIDGHICEPFEYVQADVPNESIGAVIELLGNRRGILESINQNITHTRLIYTMPSRGLIGLSTDYLTVTKGYGILNHSFLEYRKKETALVGERKLGVLVSMSEGLTSSYALGQIEDRGTMFVEPRESVYEGMIVGVANKEFDLAVNAVKEKQMSNMRSSGKDVTVNLKKAQKMSLEACLEFINDDELVEVTPKSIRLRKKTLNTTERKKYDKYH